MRAIVIVLACAAGVSGQAVYPLGDLERAAVTIREGWYPYLPGPLARNERVFTESSHTSAGGASTRRLVATDGTRAGSRVIVDWTGRHGDAALRSVRFGRSAVLPYLLDGSILGPFLPRLMPGATDGTNAWELASTVGGIVEFDVSRPVVFGNRVAFVGKRRRGGGEVWVGGHDLRLVRPLFDELDTLGFPQDQSVLLTAIGDRLLYSGPGRSGSTRHGVWTTDGTQAGTALLLETRFPPTEWSVARIGPWTLVALDHLVVRTDGSPGGTSSFLFPDGTPTLAVVGGQVIALVRLPWGRGAVYRTDGTPAGTQLAASLPASPKIGSWQPVAVAHGAAYFTLTTLTHGPAIWRTDGTPEGTRPAFLPYAGSFGPEPSQLTAVADRIFLVAGDAVWAFDGSEGVAITPPQRTGYLPIVFDPVGDRLVFDAADQGVGGLWSSDGTVAGTGPLYEVRSRTGTATSRPSPYAEVDRGFIDSQVGGERRVWQTDGTVAGTKVADFALGRPLIRWNSTMYGLHDDGVHGPELWRSDGTKAGSALVADVWPGSRGQWDETKLRVFDGALYGILDDGVHGDELWRSDGTPAGTRMVADLNPGPAGIGGPYSALFEAGSRLVVAGTNAVWESDGTTAGTRLVTRTIRWWPAYWSPPTPCALGDLVIGGALEEWALSWWAHTPGATTVTELVRTGPVGADPIVFGDAALFASDAVLFRTDGTPDGTVLLHELDGGSFTTNRTQGGTSPWVVLDRCVLLVGEDRRHGRELWRTDGTVAGTRVLRDIEPGAAGSRPMAVVPFHGGALFTAATSRHGRELWFTDGTERGTRLVADVNPGPAAGCAEPERPLVQGSRHALVFATDPEHGAEPWLTDGSRMWLLRDVRPGPASSAGSAWSTEVTSVHGIVVAALDDGVHGREPWAIDPGAAARSIEPACGRRLDGLQLDVEDPVLGARVAVEVDGLDGRLGVVIVGPPAPLLATPGPCAGIIDLTTPFAAQLLPLGANAWRGHWRVPRDPACDGWRLVAQTFVLQGVELGVSNPVLLRLGR